MTGLRGPVVVTGASSGIGRSAALELARRGADVVLAARREEGLRATATEVERLGRRAVVVPTDVSDETAVRALADRAREELGPFAAWVNNAGVYLLGTFEETPPEAFRRAVEVNFFGTVYGTRVALEQFRRQGHGVVVNTSSVLGGIGGAYVSAYSAAKSAVRSFGESLDQELRDDADIHVCTVRPASIDTPLFQQAANYTGRAARALTPTYPPQQVAEAIADLIERPRREVIVGAAGRAIDAQHRFLRPLLARVLPLQVERDQLDGPAPRTDGNLFEPVPGLETETGGWQRVAPRTRGALAAAALAVPAVAVAVRRLRD